MPTVRHLLFVSDRRSALIGAPAAAGTCLAAVAGMSNRIVGIALIAVAGLMACQGKDKSVKEEVEEAERAVEEAGRDLEKEADELRQDLQDAAADVKREVRDAGADVKRELEKARDDAKRAGGAGGSPRDD